MSDLAEEWDAALDRLGKRLKRKGALLTMLGVGQRAGERRKEGWLAVMERPPEAADWAPLAALRTLAPKGGATRSYALPRVVEGVERIAVYWNSSHSVRPVAIETLAPVAAAVDDVLHGRRPGLELSAWIEEVGTAEAARFVDWVQRQPPGSELESRRLTRDLRVHLLTGTAQSGDQAGAHADERQVTRVLRLSLGNGIVAVGPRDLPVIRHDRKAPALRRDRRNDEPLILAPVIGPLYARRGVRAE